MPTYEYQCKTCNHRFETWQKMTDEPLTICPECGGHIRRVLFPAGIVFKGSGFYKTDHRENSTVGSNGHSSDTAKGEDGTGGEKGEKKTPGESKSAESSPDTSTTKTSENKAPAGAKS
jgi:putative FmdB family regulatory protein